MSVDRTEGIRRIEQVLVNEGVIPPTGPEWTTEELTRDFEVLGFMAPYVVVRRKVDGVKGSLMFRHSPRVYFDWTPA